MPIRSAYELCPIRKIEPGKKSGEFKLTLIPFPDAGSYEVQWAPLGLEVFPAHGRAKFSPPSSHQWSSPV